MLRGVGQTDIVLIFFSYADHSVMESRISLKQALGCVRIVALFVSANKQTQ